MDIWPSSPLVERLGLDFPIVQAPMAMVAHADLVVAVSNAGGLGSLGSAVMDAARIHDEARSIRARTARAFALNFFVYPAPHFDPARVQALTARLERYRAELSLDKLTAQLVPPAFGDAMLETILAVRPPAVSFHFGLPSDEAIAALKRAGIFLLGTATTVGEAVALERAGFDAVVAQGTEAGGHRGTFAEPYGQGEIGLLSLLPQIVAAVSVPVLAAGGIADGRGIAAAFLLGAKGVQLGTAFLGSPEATLDALYRQVLREPRAANTRLTRIYTGRPARGIVTRFMDEMADQERETLEYPLQRSFTAPLAKAGLEQGNVEFHTMWAGQSAALVRELPAATLLETLVQETEQALAGSAR